MAQIYLVRHTKVDVPPGICYGASDVPLAKTFPRESQNIIKKLKGIHFDNVYSSPLSRCTLLADKLSPNNYIIDNRLQELNFGKWEMTPWDDIYSTPYGKKWMNNYLELSCPDGESYEDLRKRLVPPVTREMGKIGQSDDFISQLYSTILPDSKVLIVTHAGVMRAFMSVLKEISIQDTWDIEIKYGEIVIV